MSRLFDVDHPLLEAVKAGLSINGLTLRQAMDLPESLVERRGDDSSAHMSHLAGCGVGQLLRLVAEGEDFCERLAAGRLLGLVGDPRVLPCSVDMCEVPAADPVLGTPEQDVDGLLQTWASVGVQRDWLLKETPRHTRRVDGFRVGRFPVVNAQYRAFLLATRYPELPSSWRLGAYPWERANEPVWTVTPNAADAYCKWLSGCLGRRFRLPTEAEWEYAASGGDGRQFPWGETFRPCLANTVESGPLTTTPVGVHPGGISPFGLLDASGNVEEWVADDYRPYPGGTAVEDDLAFQGSTRVARGGSFTRFGDLGRCARRHGYYDSDLYAIGFRIAENGVPT